MRHPFFFFSLFNIFFFFSLKIWTLNTARDILRVKMRFESYSQSVFKLNFFLFVLCVCNHIISTFLVLSLRFSRSALCRSWWEVRKQHIFFSTKVTKAWLLAMRHARIYDCCTVIRTVRIRDGHDLIVGCKSVGGKLKNCILPREIDFFLCWWCDNLKKNIRKSAYRILTTLNGTSGAKGLNLNCAMFPCFAQIFYKLSFCRLGEWSQINWNAYQIMEKLFDNLSYDTT